MKDRGCKQNVRTHSILINCYCKRKMVDEAFKLFKDMPGIRLIPNTVTYNTLIGGLCDVGRSLDACKFVDEMQTNGQTPICLHMLLY
jgi:pentatricopeptide repeat protein